jgi:hypothetical protein
MMRTAAALFALLIACADKPDGPAPLMPDGGAGADGSADNDGGPDPDNWPKVVINELMARNRLAVVDDDGGHTDWFELYNPGGDDVALDGWFVTDNLGKLSKYGLDKGLVVPAGGHLVLWAAGSEQAGGTRVGFRLAEEGGAVALVAPDGALVSQIRYGAQGTDLSAARVPDGSDNWQIVWEISPGAANPAPAEVSLVIPSEPVPSEGRLEGVPSVGDVSELLLGTDVVIELDIVLSQAAIAALRTSPREWVMGALEFAGRRIEPIGVRLKGQNSFKSIDSKPAFKVSIDKYVKGAELLGVDDLTFNNMVSDGTMVHERIAYRAARLLGIPASRSNHAVVSVNGVAYGLYAHVETVDRHLLRRWYQDDTGSLYEAADADFVAAQVPLFQHDSGPDDRSALFALAEALTMPGPAAISAAAAIVDFESFFAYWGMAAVIGQFDAFPYSTPGDDYHLYIDPTSGLMKFMPWGMDETFSFPERDVMIISSVLAKRCLQDTGCTAGVHAAIWDALARIEAAGLLSEFDLVVQQIAPHVAADTRKPFSAGQVINAQADMRAFIAGRRTELTSQLPAPSN